MFTREEIIELAIEAHKKTSDRDPYRGWFEDNADWFEAFVQMIVDKLQERSKQ
jgi:hypothetical protein